MCRITKSNGEIEISFRLFTFIGETMTISEMIGQSGILTLLGMGVVFCFLIIMILAMYLLHAILHAVGADKVEEPKVAAPQTASAGTPSAADQGAVVAAIAAALHEKNI